MNSIRMPGAWVVALVLGLGVAPARAETIWLCALSDDAVRLVCIADADPLEPSHGARPVLTRLNGTAFPLDRSATWTVDLWSPPTELAQVELLARATICYRSPGCSVILPPWRQAARGGLWIAGR